MAAVISLYLDENLSPTIATQLQRRGIDVITVRDLGLLGDTDDNHLTRATNMRRVLATCDTDFLIMAADGREHAGIVFGIQENASIGDWVKGLELICSVYSPQDMVNHVEYL